MSPRAVATVCWEERDKVFRQVSEAFQENIYLKNEICTLKMEISSLKSHLEITRTELNDKQILFDLKF